MKQDKNNPIEDNQMAATELSALGGKARFSKMSPEERSEFSRRAAAKRWEGHTRTTYKRDRKTGEAERTRDINLPSAAYEGAIQIQEIYISCAVLNTGKRVLTQETFLKAIGRSGKPNRQMESDELPFFLSAANLRPFIDDTLRQELAPTVFNALNWRGKPNYGYDASLLPMVCEVYLKARDAGVLDKRQMHAAKACDLLMRGLARVGIVALVDEATGYQEFRAKDELAHILEAYVQEELRSWTKTFPDEFFRQIYRLQDWEYKPGIARRTPFVGKLINKYVYEQLPPGVLQELQRLNPSNPKGQRKHKHFQHLTADTGYLHLDKHIASVTVLMKASEGKSQFEENFARAFKGDTQMKLPLTVDVPPKEDKEE